MNAMPPTGVLAPVIRNRRFVVLANIFLGVATMRNARSRMRSCWTMAIFTAIMGGLIGGIKHAAAIGPNDQFLPDAPNPRSLGSVGYVAGVGTGTVISAKVSGNQGLITILTANHVAKDATNGVFDIGATAPFSAAFNIMGFQTYTLVDPINNPTNLPEDVSVMEGIDTQPVNAGAPQQIFNLLSANVGTVTNPGAGNGPFAAASVINPVGFTQVGYGLQGLFSANAGGANIPGYVSTGAVGQRFFQNNGVVSYTAPTTQSGYFEPLVSFTYSAPDAFGQGVAFAGDSGSPYFTGGAAGTLTITSTADGRQGQTVPIDFSNGISAIHVLGSGLNGGKLKLVGGGYGGQGVPITPGLYNWLQPFILNPAAAAPEPAALALMGIGGAALLLVRRRRRGDAA